MLSFKRFIFSVCEVIENNEIIRTRIKRWLDTTKPQSIDGLETRMIVKGRGKDTETLLVILIFYTDGGEESALSFKHFVFPASEVDEDAEAIERIGRWSRLVKPTTITNLQMVTIVEGKGKKAESFLVVLIFYLHEEE